MSNKHIKRYSATLDINEMHIKTTMKFPLTTTRVAGMKSVDKDVEKLGLYSTASGNVKWSIYFGKTACQFLKQLNIDLLYDPEIPLLGTYPREI